MTKVGNFISLINVRNGEGMVIEINQVNRIKIFEKNYTKSSGIFVHFLVRLSNRPLFKSLSLSKNTQGFKFFCT
jgi:hypothetical protein